MTTVAVLGGGVAGLSAAHQLAAPGVEVTVYEQRDAPGGKARSIPVAGSGRDGRADLPGEHGFRFFPGFYRHLTDTMGRIPFRGASVLANLVPVHEVQIAPRGSEEATVPIRIPSSPDAMDGMFRTLFAGADDLVGDDLRYFVERLLTLLTSCRERRFSEYEYQSWWQFIGAEQRSVAYRKLCADGLTRTL